MSREMRSFWWDFRAVRSRRAVLLYVADLPRELGHRKLTVTGLDRRDRTPEFGGLGNDISDF